MHWQKRCYFIIKVFVVMASSSRFLNYSHYSKKVLSIIGFIIQNPTIISKAATRSVYEFF